MSRKDRNLLLKLFKFSMENEDESCGGCNWETSTKYVIATNEEEAKKLMDEGLAGLCADCICEVLTDHYIITLESLKTLNAELDEAITAIEEWNEGKRDLTIGELFDRLARLQRMLDID